MDNYISESGEQAYATDPLRDHKIVAFLKDGVTLLSSRSTEMPPLNFVG
jgi:hypothetical protein